MKTWVLVLTMPSGGSYVLAADPKNPTANEGLALFPIKCEAGEIIRVKHCFSFDSENDARTWMAKSAALNPKTEEFFKRVSPFMTEVAQ